MRLNGDGEARVEIIEEPAKIQAELKMRTDGDAAQELAGQIVASKKSPCQQEGLAHRNAQRRGQLEAKRDFFECRDRDTTLDSLPTLAEDLWPNAREQIVQRLSVDGDC